MVLQSGDVEQADRPGEVHQKVNITVGPGIASSMRAKQVEPLDPHGHEFRLMSLNRMNDLIAIHVCILSH